MFQHSHFIAFGSMLGGYVSFPTYEGLIVVGAWTGIFRESDVGAGEKEERKWRAATDGHEDTEEEYLGGQERSVSHAN